MVYNATDKDLDDLGEDLARDNAEMYEHLVDIDDFDSEEEYEDALERYYDDAVSNYDFVEITEEEYEDSFAQYSFLLDDK